MSNEFVGYGGVNVATQSLNIPSGLDLTIASGATLTGTGTATFTSPTLTTPTLTTPTVSRLILSDQKVCTATVTATTNVTLANVTGLTGFTLTASGVYIFECYLQTTCTTNGGISLALKYTTATVTAMQLEATTFAASSVGCGLSTTTTDATKYIDNKSAAWLVCILRGSLTVGTGGTVAIQFAQNTSHADTTSVLIGSWARFTRAS